MAESAAVKTSNPGRPMELEGNLGAFQLPDILKFLSMGAMSGKLTLSGDRRTISLKFKDGRLVGSASPGRMLRLGDVLVTSGLLRRRELDDVLDHQREELRGPAMLGDMLIQRQLVSAEQVSQALALQIKEELWEALSWDSGSFKFEHGPVSDHTRDLVALEIGPLLEEGAARMNQWRDLDRHLNDLRRIYTVRADLATMPEARVNPNTWRILSLINGRRSLQVLIYLAGLGKFETLCAIDQLLGLQLIELVEEPGIAVRGKSSPESHGSQAERASHDPGETGGIRALFGRRRRGEGQGGAVYQGQCGPFASCVGFGCALLNRLNERCGAVTQTDEQPITTLLDERLWREHGLRFRRADLVEWREGRLDASLFEHYALRPGAPKYITGCLEDSMAALGAIGRQMIDRADGQFGPRGMRIIEEVTLSFSDRVEIGWPADFQPRAWIQQWSER